MSKNLIEKGNLPSPLLLYNRTAQRALDFASQFGPNEALAVPSIAQGVSLADIIFIMLSDDTAVTSTLEEILTQDVTGKLIIDCSTIHPSTTEKLAEAATTQGAEFLTAPVFGAPAAADTGQLIAVLAGPKATVGRAQPFFKGVTSRSEIDMSDEPRGKALTLKLIGNSFILNMVEQLAEGHVLAEKSGLGNGYLHQFVESLFPGPCAAYSTRMLSGDYYKREEPLFAVDLARKDARHIISLAEASGTKVHNVETADAHLAKLKEYAGAKGDIAGIYGAVRLEAGLGYEKD